MSWRIPRNAITDLFYVIVSMRHLESEQQIISLRPAETAFDKPSFIANASATRAEAI